MSPSTRSLTLRFLSDSFRHFLPNSQAVALAVILTVSFVLIYSLSSLLMPVFASIVLAYLLEGLVGQIENRGLSRLSAVYLVFAIFMASLGFLLFYLLPLISQQAVELVQQIPDIINSAQKGIMRLPDLYPKLITEAKIRQMMVVVQTELLSYGQNMLSFSAASVVGVISAMVYLFLVPMMIFFLLKDKALLVV